MSRRALQAFACAAFALSLTACGPKSSAPNCAAGQVLCNNACVDEKANCEGCGVACLDPQGGTASCVNRQCVAACASGAQVCGGSRAGAVDGGPTAPVCADMTRDVFNCGSC